MAKKKQTQQEILERWQAAKSLTKVAFCEVVGLSRPTFDKYLDGEYISLEWLTYLAVDYADDWRGVMACELIEVCHGPQYVPVGTRQELMGFREFLKTCETNEDMGVIGAMVRPEHFGLWAAELRKRSNEQLAQAKAEMRAVTA